MLGLLNSCDLKVQRVWLVGQVANSLVEVAPDVQAVIDIEAARVPAGNNSSKNSRTSPITKGGNSLGPTYSICVTQSQLAFIVQPCCVDVTLFTQEKRVVGSTSNLFYPVNVLPLADNHRLVLFIRNEAAAQLTKIICAARVDLTFNRQ